MTQPSSEMPDECIWERAVFHLLLCPKEVRECLRCQAIQRLLEETTTGRDHETRTA